MHEVRKCIPKERRVLDSTESEANVWFKPGFDWPVGSKKTNTASHHLHKDSPSKLPITRLPFANRLASREPRAMAQFSDMRVCARWSSHSNIIQLPTTSRVVVLSHFTIFKRRVHTRSLSVQELDPLENCHGALHGEYSVFRTVG